MKSTVTGSEAKSKLSQKKAFKNAQRRASIAKGVGAQNSAPKLVPTLELFQMESCPFSHAVRNELSGLGLDYIAHNVTEPLKHEQLVQAGGKDQIPFLVDHQTGVKLYESSAIIAYLQNEYGDRVAPRADRFRTQILHRLRGRAEVIRWMAVRPIERARDARETIEGTIHLARGTVSSLLEPLRSLRRAAAPVGDDASSVTSDESDSATATTRSTKRAA